MAANDIVWDDERPDDSIIWDDEKPKRQPALTAEQRFVAGVYDPIHGAAQIADRYLVDPIRQFISPGATSMRDVTRERDADYRAPEGSIAARMAGNLANPVTWAGGGAGPARAATAGAVQGALSPVGADQSFESPKATGRHGGRGRQRAPQGTCRADPHTRSACADGSGHAANSRAESRWTGKPDEQKLSSRSRSSATRSTSPATGRRPSSRPAI